MQKHEILISLILFRELEKSLKLSYSTDLNYQGVTGFNLVNNCFLVSNMNSAESHVIMDSMQKLSMQELRKGLHGRFCLVPFTNIILEPDGKVGICRNKGDNFPIGNIKDQPLDEIWNIRNSEKAQQWRREFLEDKISICENEVNYRKCHLEYGFNTLAQDAELSIVQQQKILRLTANLNGQCNLRCPFCTVWQSPNGNYNDENFWNPAKSSLFPFLKEIDMLGGEPFIQADTYRLIQEVSLVNPDCHWFFTTNLAWSLSLKVSEILDKIKIQILTVSIDSLTPAIYEQLRPPAKLNKILNHLEKLIEYNKKRIRPFQIAINSLVMKETWQELPEFLRFTQKYQLAFNPILLRTPQESSLMSFTHQQKREVLDFYLKEIPKNHFKLITPILIPLIESLSPIDRAYYFSAINS